MPGGAEEKPIWCGKRFGARLRDALLDIVANPLNALLHVARDIIAFVAQEPGH